MSVFASDWPRWWMDAGHPAGRLLAPLGALTCRIARGRLRRFCNTFDPTFPTAVVVVVGNVTVGGSGKTPLLLLLAELLREAELPFGIISRGYGGRGPFPLVVGPQTPPQQCGDEPALIARRLECPLVVDPYRDRAARTLLERHPQVRVILSDDGLQHYALPRDLEVVVADGVRGAGNGRCLPAGPLREPWRRVEEVDFRISNGAGDRAELAGWPVMRLEPVAWRRLDGSRLPLSALAGRTVRALAGIGNPQRFFDTVRELGVAVSDTVALPDHASTEQLQRVLEQTPGPWVMTEKDAIKCQPDGAGERYWLEVAARLPSEWEQAWLARVRACVEEKYEPQAAGYSGMPADQDEAGL